MHPFEVAEQQLFSTAFLAVLSAAVEQQWHHSRKEESAQAVATMAARSLAATTAGQELHASGASDEVFAVEVVEAGAEPEVEEQAIAIWSTSSVSSGATSADHSPTLVHRSRKGLRQPHHHSYLHHHNPHHSSHHHPPRRSNRLICDDEQEVGHVWEQEELVSQAVCEVFAAQEGQVV